MTRTAARELAVRLCFAAQLSGDNAEETVASSALSPESCAAKQSRTATFR